jgi:uncharacterized protein
LAGEIKSILLSGPAGRLEALLNAGEPHATHSAVVCHPHPQFGGTMHNKVVFHAAKALSSFGFPVLRFNFRGTGLSEGEHDYGRGEVDDVHAALKWLRNEFGRPMIFAGFSFGAATGLKAVCDEADVTAVISLGTPVKVEERAYAYQFLKHCTKPKLFVSGGRDQYGPRAELQAVVEQAAEPKKLVLVNGADHFFEGHLPDMQAAIREWLPQALAPAPASPYLAR